MKSEKVFLKLIPIMLAFFVMGFVDLVGIATNYVKTDFGLSDTVANLFPSMVFFWFLVLSVPTGILMNRIGRKNTVLVSLSVTVAALVLPMIGYNFGIMMVSFCLLGIGNTLLQVALNPLVSNIVSDKRLASTMTFGQFVKAIAAFLAPLIAGWATVRFGDWKLLYPVFMLISVLAVLFLGLTRITENEPAQKGSGFADCFRLLGNSFILLSFLGIVSHVGLDVGINLTLPKIMMERVGLPLEEAGFATVLYFIFRTVGSFTGAFILARFSGRVFFPVSVFLMILAVIGLFIFSSPIPLYIAIALIGMGNANIFPMIVSQALLYMPDKKNEISGLMIMGLFGGTLFPLVMGVLSDGFGSQNGAVLVLAVGILYLLFYSTRLRKA